MTNTNGGVGSGEELKTALRETDSSGYASRYPNHEPADTVARLARAEAKPRREVITVVAKVAYACLP